MKGEKSLDEEMKRGCAVRKGEKEFDCTKVGLTIHINTVYNTNVMNNELQRK